MARLTADSPQPAPGHDLAALAQWFSGQKRELPWRQKPEPYAIWISEIMAQQTTLKAVIPYFERFTRRFPTIEALAAAELDEVLTLWAGLGYYRRARMLHAAAKLIALQGFPRTAAALRELPGIGEYTSAAIASIAFGERVALVDGNVERVITRLFGVLTDPARGKARKLVRERASELIQASPAAPGDHNQAMMELGSLICRPFEAARCKDCPLRSSCWAYENKAVARLPAKAPRPPSRERLDRCFFILNPQNQILLGKIPPDAVWGGLYEMPRMSRVNKDEIFLECAEKYGAEAIGCPIQVESERPALTLQHGVMNEKITLEVYKASLSSPAQALQYSELRWLSAHELHQFALSSPQRRALKKLFDSK